MILHSTTDKFYVTQVPIPSLANKNRNYFEKAVSFKVSQLKIEIRIDDIQYSLFGVLIFRRPLLQDGIGHYVAAIRVDDEFVIFDDSQRKS